MFHLVCFFMKTHPLALLQANCLDLVCCAFLRKLSACVRNITAFCQQLLRPMKSAVLADTDISVKPKYRPIYRSTSNFKRAKRPCQLNLLLREPALHSRGMHGQHGLTLRCLQRWWTWVEKFGNALARAPVFC